jgi:hypothetical protein
MRHDIFSFDLIFCFLLVCIIVGSGQFKWVRPLLRFLFFVGGFSIPEDFFVVGGGFSIPDFVVGGVSILDFFVVGGFSIPDFFLFVGGVSIISPLKKK